MGTPIYTQDVIKQVGIIPKQHCTNFNTQKHCLQTSRRQYLRLDLTISQSVFVSLYSSNNDMEASIYLTDVSS